MNYRYLLLLGSLALFFSCKIFLQEDATILSPNGDIRVSFEVREGKLFYNASYKQLELIEKSGMGYRLNEADLSSGFEIADIIKTSFKDSWKPVWGEKSRISNNYNELLVRLHQIDDAGRKLNIYFRVFNDGFAFRYIIPHQTGLNDINVLSEESQFNFKGNHLSWWIPANFDSYEYLYTESSLEEIEAVNTPFTIKVSDSMYVAIHEAHLEDYAGMTLQKSKTKLFGFESNLVPWADGTKVKGSVPLISPWRTVQISETAGGLIESDMIVNLNPQKKIETTDWIKPMKYIGVWWGMHIGYETWTPGRRHGASTRNVKRYIDFAAENDIQGVLIEGWNQGWEHWGDSAAFDQVTPASDFDLEEVAAYAKEKGVVLMGHHETGGDAIYYESQVDTAFQLFASLGVPVVKTGYAGSIRPEGEYHHGQYMVNHYRKILEKAADYKLMLNVHEPVKPTGERRTYPNMMTREGVRGMEWNAWSTGNPPEHTTILPFTRGLAGPIDYTPGIFDLLLQKHEGKLYDWNAKPKEGVRVHTTLVKQLALMLVLYSPLTMAADLPENYEDTVSFKFIRDLPVTWEDSKIIHGEPGDFITVARHRQNTWFVGSITDELARELPLKLDFLTKGEDYQVKIYADTDSTHWESSPLYYEVLDTVLRSDDQWTMKLAPGGGQVMKFSPL